MARNISATGDYASISAKIAERPIQQEQAASFFVR
jgi:hypothetical protein